jgi:hypothetical protein
VLWGCRGVVISGEVVAGLAPAHVSSATVASTMEVVFATDAWRGCGSAGGCR